MEASASSFWRRRGAMQLCIDRLLLDAKLHRKSDLCISFFYLIDSYAFVLNWLRGTDIETEAASGAKTSSL